MTAPEATAGPHQLIVLGMHRSGTSTVTGLLTHAGAAFGPAAAATAANEENPRGFWERRDVRGACDGLLAAAGCDWWSAADLDPTAVPAEAAAPHLAALGAVVAELDETPPWVLKEPRLCLLLPLVRPLLAAPTVVLVTRHPLEVARSVDARNHFGLPAALALWELYTARALVASAAVPTVQVRYERLVEDPVRTTARLVADLTALGVAGLRDPEPDVTTGFVTADLHRQRADEPLGEHLNARQAALAATLDEGDLDAAREVVADRSAPGGAGLSGGAASALRALVPDEEQRSRLAAAEAEARLARLAEQQAAERLAASQRAFQELRREANRPLWVLAGRRGVAAAVRGKRRVTHAAHDPGGSPALRRMVATAATVRSRRTGTTDRVPSHEGPAPVVHVGPRPEPTERTRVAVLAWDVGHNPLGRAAVLAELLARHFDVEIWGAQFARYGTDVWAPLRETGIPLNVFDGRAFPSHLATMEHVAAQIDADVLYVSKPRLPSLLLGILAKEARRRPLVLDVDDHELAFFGEDAGIDARTVLARRGDDDLLLPFERTWTRACEPVATSADLVTVSGPTLQDRYGGLWVPHARDERLFDPSRYDRPAVRERLGVGPDHRLLLFGGTPRAHKGVGRVLDALDELDDDRYRLAVFGSRELAGLRAEIGPQARWLLPVPEVPFHELAGTVVAADLACVLQDPSHPVAAHQTPAKLTDALALEVPCLVTATPPLAPFVQRGVVQVLDPGASLAATIDRIFTEPDPVRAAARRGRRVFLDELSYAAVGARLAPAIEALAADPPPLAPALAELAATTRAVWSRHRGTATPAPREAPPPQGRSRAGPERRWTAAPATPLTPGATFDLLVVWKQNDTGLYGRRQDMILRYLLRSGRVASAVHLDEPVDPETLARLWLRGAGATADQSGLVVRETLARIAHRRDDGAVRARTFLHGGPVTGRLGLRPRRDHPAWVARTVARAGFGTRPLVLWTYPPHHDLPAVLDAVVPDLVVADVVDDARSWTRPGSAAHRRIEQSYRDVLAHSDLVLANCEPVARAMRPLASDVHVVPNACEPPDQLPGGPPPPEVAALDGPLLGYVGNLSSRLDVDLIEAVARTRPRWQVLLVGSAHLDPTILRLDGLPNVHVLGVRPYEEALRIVSHLDVGLIPHLVNDMTEAMNPLKAFVYASAGVPVVSTPVANLDTEVGDVTVAEGRDGFIAAVEAALARGRRRPAPDELAPHAWPARVDRILELIDVAAVRSSPGRSPGAGSGTPDRGGARPGTGTGARTPRPR